MKKKNSVRHLHKSGKIHKRIIFQTRLLTLISLVMFGVSLYHLFIGTINFWILLVLTIVSFLLGMVLFSKMNKVVWDEEQEIITITRIERLGVLIIILYVLFEISLRTFLNYEFTEGFAATAYLLAGISCTLLGRSVGTILAVKKLVEKENLNQKTLSKLK